MEAAIMLSHLASPLIIALPGILVLGKYIPSTKMNSGFVLSPSMAFFIANKEALRILNYLIESVITGNNTYSLKNFKADVKQAQEEVEEL